MELWQTELYQRKDRSDSFTWWLIQIAFYPEQQQRQRCRPQCRTDWLIDSLIRIRLHASNIGRTLYRSSSNRLQSSANDGMWKSLFIVSKFILLRKFIVAVCINYWWCAHALKRIIMVVRDKLILSQENQQAVVWIIMDVDTLCLIAPCISTLTYLLT